MKIRSIYFSAAAIFALAASLITAQCGGRKTELNKAPEPKVMFGIACDNYDMEQGEIEPGQNISALLSQYGVSTQRIDRLNRCEKETFDPGNIKAGHDYYMFFTPDSARSLAWMVYQESTVNFLVFNLQQDSIVVSRFSKEVTTVRERRTGKITSSLWNCMAENKMSPGMAMELSDIFAWTIDFFALQQGDEFTVVYDEMFVDSLSVGAGRIWGAIFKHGGKEYCAIPFKHDGKIQYWDEDGNSLKKSLLKAPLKFSRISSKFTAARYHPILRIFRPHYGVDYAAPAGTPVHSVSDGTIISCGWAGGGGNTIKIKHSAGMVSSYMHLRGYASGMKAGRHVSQGELIGYVGSTGLSTGAHLDFRLYINNKPVDPLKVVSPPSEPISAANIKDFKLVRDRILAEVRGELADSLRITQLDSISLYNFARRDTTAKPNR